MRYDKDKNEPVIKSGFILVSVIICLIIVSCILIIINKQRVNSNLNAISQVNSNEAIARSKEQFEMLMHKMTYSLTPVSDTISYKLDNDKECRIVTEINPITLDNVSQLPKELKSTLKHRNDYVKINFNYDKLSEELNGINITLPYFQDDYAVILIVKNDKIVKYYLTKNPTFKNYLCRSANVSPNLAKTKTAIINTPFYNYNSKVKIDFRDANTSHILHSITPYDVRGRDDILYTRICRENNTFNITYPEVKPTTFHNYMENIIIPLKEKSTVEFDEIYCVFCNPTHPLPTGILKHTNIPMEALAVPTEDVRTQILNSYNFIRLVKRKDRINKYEINYKLGTMGFNRRLTSTLVMPTEHDKSTKLPTYYTLYGYGFNKNLITSLRKNDSVIKFTGMKQTAVPLEPTIADGLGEYYTYIGAMLPESIQVNFDSIFKRQFQVRRHVYLDNVAVQKDEYIYTMPK